MKFVTVEKVILLHDRLILENGGLQGIRDMGLLLSALEMPKASMFGEFLHPSIFDKASAYLYHIICNHPFLDGNKRTGAATALIFLEINEINLEFEDTLYEELVVRVADGKAQKPEISEFFMKAT